jgi:hypothetical protein
MRPPQHHPPAGTAGGIDRTEVPIAGRFGKRLCTASGADPDGRGDLLLQPLGLASWLGRS